jgi:hypothetical protein
MLRRDVVEAAAAGTFRVFAVGHVDQGIEILTGVPAGEADADGAWPEGSVNHRVRKRLRAFADCRQTFSAVAVTTVAGGDSGGGAPGS